MVCVQENSRMKRLKPSEARNKSRKYLPNIRQNVDYAFNFGTHITIRTLVRHDDNDAIKCTRCWDEVRMEAADPDCPLCQGSGYISEITLTGYRFRVFSMAHVSEIADEEHHTEQGIDEGFTNSFWVNFTERELKDGDLIAIVEPDDLDKPRYVNEVIQMFEVTSAQPYSLHPDFISHKNE